jgi:hypothetical protein
MKELPARPTLPSRAKLMAITGNAGAAAMLRIVMDCTIRHEAPKWDGWTYLTRTKWKQYTTYSRKAQVHYRAILRDLGFVAEAMKGLPRRLYFRANLEAIYAVLEETPSSVEYVRAAGAGRIKALARSAYASACLSIARAKKHGLIGIYAEYVSYDEVLLRDGLICFHCAQPIEKAPSDEPDSLTFYNRVLQGDHIPENIHPAHLACRHAAQQSHQLHAKFEDFPQEWMANKDAEILQFPHSNPPEIQKIDLKGTNKMDPKGSNKMDPKGSNKMDPKGSNLPYMYKNYVRKEVKEKNGKTPLSPRSGEVSPADSQRGETDHSPPLQKLSKRPKPGSLVYGYAGQVCDACHVSPARGQKLIAQQMKMACDDGASPPDRIAALMITAWEKMHANKHKLRYEPMFTVFFGDGMWRDEERWPWDRQRIQRR